MGGREAGRGEKLRYGERGWGNDWHQLETEGRIYSLEMKRLASLRVRVRKLNQLAATLYQALSFIIEMNILNRFISIR